MINVVWDDVSIQVVKMIDEIENIVAAVFADVDLDDEDRTIEKKNIGNDFKRFPTDF